MTRLWILALLGSAAGALGVLAASRHLARAIHFRFERGRPYVPGSIRRAAAGLGLSLLLAGAGGLALLTALSLRPYAPIAGEDHVGDLEVSSSGGGEYLLELRLPGRPGAGETVQAVGLTSPSWEVSGWVFALPPWAGFLGVEGGHVFLGPGSPEGEASGRPPGLGSAWLASLDLGWRAERRVLAGEGELPEGTALIVSRTGYALRRAADPEAEADDSGVARWSFSP
jgi:hypothetical protein